jgi:hypothetical protein
MSVEISEFPRQKVFWYIINKYTNGVYLILQVYINSLVSKFCHWQQVS